MFMREELPGNHDNHAEDELIASILDRSSQSAGEVYGDEDEGFADSLRQLTERFDIHPEAVLYPGSSKHAGVGRVFGQDKVVHVDPDTNAMEVMASHGYAVQAGRLEDYLPERQFDLIISYNAGTLEPPELERLLVPGGYVIANNWHGSANNLSFDGHFRLLGAVLPSIHDGTVRDVDEATDGLGTTRLAVTREGEVVSGDDIDESTMSVMENEKSPDGLFLFKHEEPNEGFSVTP